MRTTPIRSTTVISGPAVCALAAVCLANQAHAARVQTNGWIGFLRPTARASIPAHGFPGLTLSRPLWARGLNHAATNDSELAVGLTGTPGVLRAALGLGGPVIDEDSQTGISDTNGGNVISVGSPLMTTADSSANGFDISLSLVGNAGADVSVTSTGTATGVAGNGGDDTITINSTLTTSAVASADVDSMVLNLGDAASALGSVTATATATGVHGGEGNDTITNAGDITVSAFAEANGGPFEITLIDVAGGFVDTVVTAQAIAIGIDGGAGNDVITNGGDILTSAFPNMFQSQTLNLSVIGNPAVETARIAEGHAIGIAGGAGDDVITNNGTITSMGGSFISVMETTLDIAATDISSMDAPVVGTSVAVGIDGGDGADTIINNNLIDVLSSGLLSFDAEIGGIISVDNPIAQASAEFGISAIDDARGIIGGGSDDTIENRGSILVEAAPTVTTMESDFAIVGTIHASAASRADGSAVGIDGGAGNDTITNASIIEVDATPHTNTTAVTMALGLLPVPTGLVFPFANAIAISAGEAVGIDGGAGNDIITNSGTITASATATMTSIEVNAKLGLSGSSSGGGGGGGGGGVALMAGDAEPSSTIQATVDASTARRSFATGATGGDGDDHITNTGVITVTTDASSVEVNANATLSIAVSGRVAASAPNGVSTAGVDPPETFVDADVIARTIVSSTALGIDGGDGHDTIVNSGAINATANASAVDVGAKANIAIPASPLGLIGLAAGVDSMSFTESLAVGLAGGNGSDNILNEALVTVRADSGSVAVAAELNTQVTIPFLDPLVPLMESDVSTLAAADAIGIHGDDPNDAFSTGDDVIHNSSTIDVGAEATSTGVDVTVTLAGWSAGNAATVVDASATGIDAGAGNDIVSNAGTLIATSTSSGSGVSVDVTLASIDFLFGPVVGDVATTANATSLGMDGGAGDDQMLNTGSITSTATATGNVNTVDIQLAGFSIDDGSSSATALARVMLGGSEDDIIVSDGAINASANASVDVDLVVINALAGASITDSTGTLADAAATGVHAGTGNDSVTWTQAITVGSTANATAGAFNLESIGATIHSAGLTTNATATGVHGGLGEDVINAMSTVTVTSTATSGSTSLNLNLAGAAVANADSGITATAEGIGGGAGNDHITVHDTITASATSNTSASGVAISLVGAGVQHAGVTVDAHALGVSGGDDNDAILNLSTIDIDAVSTGHAGAVNVNLIGASVGDASLQVSASAIGIAGGNGNDLVINQGTVFADATGTATLSNFEFDLAGVASADLGDASTTARPVATGMAGAAGNDTLQNESTIEVTATASLSTGTSAAIDIFGVAGVNAIVAAASSATGMSGGDGDDILLNLDLVDSTSSATMNLLSGTSFSFGGVASDGAQVTGTASAFGLAGGDGDDSIRSEGSIVSAATATLDVDSDSDVVFGTASASSQTNATASTYGIDGGTGADAIENLGSIDATSTSSTTATQSAWGFGGAPSTNAVLESASVSNGIRGGTGNDWIHNGSDGSISATAISTLTSTSGASATFGTAQSSATVGATTTAIGIDSEAGRDTVVNDGEIMVRANGAVSASNDSDAGFFFGEAGAEANASGLARVRGIRGRSGSDHIMNSGLISVTLDDTSGAATVHAQSNSDGGDITFDGDARTTSTASLTATALGIGGGKGNNVLTNTGAITVLNAPKVSATSISDGDGLDGDGVGSAHVDVGTFQRPVTAIGIAARDGDNDIVNDGTLTVEASPRGAASVNVDGDGAGTATGQAVTTVRAAAFGIIAGDGRNTIVNNGDIHVATHPRASASSVSSPGWAAGSFQIVDAAAVAHSVGIQGGDGGNTIINTGVVDVRADATATVSATTDGLDPDTDFLMDFATENRDATGILTGSGDDRIINAGDGLIATQLNGITGAGIGIDSGAGNDLVRLLDESTVAGEIRLGEGDDVIAIGGTAAFSDQIIGGNGFDTLRLAGQRTLSMASADLGIEQLDVNKGRLELDGDYALLDGGLQVDLFSGGHGVLAINGVANIGGDSTITVNARPRAYVDGDTFDVLTGSAVNGTFATENLTDSFFLDFDVTYLPDAVRIEAAVTPFMAAATNRVARAVGGYLDQIAPGASGDLGRVIGEFQLLTNPTEIAADFSSLSPDTYDSVSRTTLDVGRAYSRMLHDRLRAVRMHDRDGATSTPPSSQPSSNDAAMGALQDDLAVAAQQSASQSAESGFWLSGLGQWGQQDTADGFTGFDYTTTGATLGFDHSFSENLLAGVAIGYTGTDIDFDANRGSGDITGCFGSLYGGWTYDNAWLDATFSYGHQRYDNSRRVTVGGINRITQSEHDGDLLAASLAGGIDFDLTNEWRFEPYGAFHYAHLSEDGFHESGAGGADLLIDSRTVNALISELGVRLAGDLQHKGTLFAPYLGAAWVHDFEIDDAAITSAFVSAPGTSFTLNGLNVNADRLRVEVGLGISNGNLSGSLKYYAELGSDYDDQGILGSLSIGF